MPWPAGALRASHHRTTERSCENSASARLWPRRSISVTRGPSGSWSPLDVVVIWPGPRRVAASFQDPSRTLRIHTEGPLPVLEACRAEQVGKLIYVSSAKSTDAPSLPGGGGPPLSARSPYAQRRLVPRSSSRLSSMRRPAAVILRPFSIYGPGASSESLIPRIIDMACRGLPVLLET